MIDQFQQWSGHKAQSIRRKARYRPGGWVIATLICAPFGSATGAFIAYPFVKSGWAHHPLFMIAVNVGVCLSIMLAYVLADYLKWRRKQRQP